MSTNHSTPDASRQTSAVANPAQALQALETELERAHAAGDRALLAALYERGAEIAAQDPALAERQVCMAIALGDLYAAEGDYQAAASAYDRHAPQAAPPLLLVRLGLALLAHDPACAAQRLYEALQLVSPGYHEDLRVRLEAGLVWAMALGGSTYEAERYGREALAKLGDTSGLGAARTLMRGTLGMVLFYQGSEEEARPHLESARAGWEARGDMHGVLLMNRVLSGAPRQEITPVWLRVVLAPLLQITPP